MAAAARFARLGQMAKTPQTMDWKGQMTVAAQIGFSEGWPGLAALAVVPIVDRAEVALRGKVMAKQD